MTQAFVEGKRIPLTVLTVDPHVVISSKTTEKDGYESTVLAIGSKKKLNKPLAGHFKKLGIDKTPKHLREVSTIEGAEMKSEINLSEVLVPGTKVSVTSMSKGKGTSGVMKRHGFHGGNRTHGQSDRSRAPGSISRGTTPGRILPGKKMAGIMGGENVALRNLTIHSYDPATGILQITGAIAGGRGALAKIVITKKSNI